METLHDALVLMTQVVVVRGNGFDPTLARRQRPSDEIVADVSDPAALAQLAAALDLTDDDDDDDQQDGMAWIAHGTTLALYAGREHLGSVTALGGEWARSSWWPWDRVLKEPGLLDDWLVAHVPGRVLRDG